MTTICIIHQLFFLFLPFVYAPYPQGLMSFAGNLPKVVFVNF